MTPFGPEEKILEVGGGANPRHRPNLDVRPLPTVDIVADLNGVWPVKDGEYDGVFSMFVMEHVSWRNIRVFVGEIFRAIRPGGTAFVITANTEAQMRWALGKPTWDEKIGQCVFGDLDYPENSHKVALNPDFVIKLFRGAGFSDVAVLPFGELGTDMTVTARKPEEKMAEQGTVPTQTGAVSDPAKPSSSGPASWTSAERRLAYNRHYFDGGRGPVGGYAREGYQDFPCHWTTFRKIMEKKPESVLELGPARGFVLKHLQDSKIPAQGLEVSRHCILTRACDGIAEWDLTETPWPFKDEEFDLCYSVAVLEHIPEHAIDRVADEIRRVSRRGLHGIDFGDHDDGFDKSHCLFRDKIWWTKKLNQAGDDASGIQEVLEKDDLERGDPSPPGPDGLLKINVGSHQRMFHHGWVNVDVLPLEEFAAKNRFIYRKMDARGGLPCPNRCADFLYASHFLEHLNPEDGRKFLREAFRIMRPGGVVRIVVPDTRRLSQHYLNGTLGVFDEISDGCAGTPWQSAKLWELLFQGHLALYDLDSLQGELRAAGFQDVRVQAFRKSVSLQLLTETVDLFPELSLFVEAVRHE